MAGESFKRILKRASLETRFKVRLQMSDYEHWDNGLYLGEQDKKLLEPLLKAVEEWIADGATLRNEEKTTHESPEQPS